MIIDKLIISALATKRVLSNLFQSLGYFLYVYLIVCPVKTFLLLMTPKYYNAPSYYPERKRKPTIQIFFEQLYTLWHDKDILYFYFMYGLDTRPFKDTKTYLTHHVFSRRRKQLNLDSPFNSACILRNKLHFGLFASSIGIPTPENVACIRNGELYLIAEKRYMPLDEFVKIGNNRLFCKELEGECGVGIFEMIVKDGKCFINGEEKTAKEVLQKIGNATYLFQKTITNQHPAINAIYDKSINTIRMVTIKNLKTGKIDVMPSIMRIGSRGSRVDNTSQGGYLVQVDLETGKLHKFGFMKPRYGTKCEEHFDSKVRFEDCTIPYFGEAKQMALHFHNLLGNLHSIGWDIAITEDGPMFIEGNDNWEISGPQTDCYGWRDIFNQYFFK